MIDVRLRLFIPLRNVLVPLGPAGEVGFDGDNREFSFNAGITRADLWVDVDNSTTTTPQPVVIK